MARTWRWCRLHLDALAATVLTLAAAVIVVSIGVLAKPGAWPASLCMIGAAAGVAWRRRYPVVVAAGAGALIAVPYLTPYASVIYNSALFLPLTAALFLYAFALGSDAPWRWSLVGLAALTVGLNATGGGFNPLNEMLTIGPWAAGLVVASRRRSVAQLELRTRELDAEREVFAVQSVRYERARIARELHDIVAHCVSLIVVQANAGEHLAHDDPDSAAEAFESISEAARQAETEIDRLVELLDTSAPSAGPPGLRIVEELVRRVQASGLHITCQFSGDSDALCDESAEAAYRLVQEGVTNAMKHAPGAPIRIVVQGRNDSIEVEVCNRSATGASSGLESTGGGHGLAGMRERVARCGGTFSAGPTVDRGWSVVASLPRQRDHRQIAVAP